MLVFHKDPVPVCNPLHQIPMGMSTISPYEQASEPNFYIRPQPQLVVIHTPSELNQLLVDLEVHCVKNPGHPLRALLNWLVLPCPSMKVIHYCQVLPVFAMTRFSACPFSGLDRSTYLVNSTVLQ